MSQAAGKLDELRYETRSSLMADVTPDELALYISTLQEKRDTISTASLIEKLKADLPGFTAVLGRNGQNTLTSFVIMTKRQRRRLFEYGQALFIDATYSTTTVSCKKQCTGEMAYC